MPFQNTGFSTFEAAPNPPTGHIHESVEISVFEGGPAAMMYGGKRVSVPENRLVLHWGMLPHRAFRMERRVKVIGLHIPLAWMLQWDLPGDLLASLLRMEMRIEASRDEPCSDLALLKNWHCLRRRYGRDAEGVILPEVRARLHRIALEKRSSPVQSAVAQGAQAFHRALYLLVQGFREPMQMEEVAQKTGIGVRHLSRLFRENTGETFNSYVTGLRAAHAQWLLATTERTVTDIMYDSGFTCPTHFYKVFRSQTGSTPHRFRQQQEPSKNAT